MTQPPDNDAGAGHCLRVCACVRAAARWKHDEPVQLGGFRGGGGEGPHPVLFGLRRQEGAADRQGVPLRGHRFGTQEPFIPVSEDARRLCRRCCVKWIQKYLRVFTDT